MAFPYLNLDGRDTYNDVEFEFRVCPALASKPATAEATNNTAFEQLPKYGPGSDLVDADPGLIVTKIHGTHLLVLNRFAVFRPQYLILTLDSFRRQTENLDETDLKAASLVLDHLSHEHFIMFNCGNEAGCSRLHKHMQVIPCLDGFTLFPDVEGLDPESVPFRYFIRRIEPGTDGALDSLLPIYERLRNEAYEAWQAYTGDTLDYFPHNMMLTKRWMMVVPRRRVAAAQGATANAAGMMGMVWVTNTQQMDRWQQPGPAQVLAELGVPTGKGM
ncbi:uncharacterized protein Z519_09639 [Cladophialophora bantiana CBS 173.52]|uniref:Phosphorylase n=1 Tax=Cladophialophora bantiana (strain ATCC 10958 / CBS 173.52 / CDC B-1940 / NIH 8579) TaxID=1442370 RepID=A0A0D2H8A1_CLAB1|nr:uncharacterized protein Z519_09639 [Cladophialophora bantiana CBS 173.52]KIW89483.1 hypothetical protein Z519_09639 [Cladophialophora bantiana CBS 173.52]